MTKKRIFITALIVIAIILLSVFYWWARIFYYFSHHYLEISNGSYSKSESLRSKQYLGEYVPNKRVVILKNKNRLKIENAWVENEFRYKEIVLFFIQVKVNTGRYCINVPPMSIGNPLNANYFVELLVEDEKYSTTPGIGFSDSLGFSTCLDVLPDSIRFLVEQKKNVDDSWEDAVPVDTITYKKMF